MLNLVDQRFPQLVQEVFGSTMEEFGFEFGADDKYLLSATKDDIKILFRLEGGYQYRLFSLEIVLSGELGEKAAAKPRYRHMSASTFALYLDPDYKPLGIPSTEAEVRESMQIQKERLLKYCTDIFNGDLTRWQMIVELAMKDAKARGMEI